MGITLNVWIFSGIIGVAYIMGYMMSRTMGRVLAVEGADPETEQRESAAWSERTLDEGRAKSERAKRQYAAVMPERVKRQDGAMKSERAKRQDGAMKSERAKRQDGAVMSERTERQYAAEIPGRAAHQNAAVMSERAAWPDVSEMLQRAACQGELEMSGRTAWPDVSEMSQRAACQGASEMSGKVTWPDETAWEEESVWEEEPEIPVRQKSQTKTGRARRAAGQTARESDRKSYGGETREWQKARIPRRYRGRSHRDQQAKPAGHPIASPVAGHVDVLEGQGRRGVLLTPEDNRVYAPASGKIIHLYPRGNEFLLRTDSGVVLRLQAGERDAEMTRDYFRPRIMQNEFVSKGKLLLEYDREALARDGYDTHVSMTVEEEERSYDLSVTGSMWVKNGQDCLWVL